MIKHTILVLAAICPVVVTPTFADTEQAETLHAQFCTDCHGRMTDADGSVLYTRKQRLVNDFSALQERVAYCAEGADTGWQREQIEQVVNYLNSQYYHF